MTDDDMLNLQHQVERHEGDLDRQLKEIQTLKQQNRELKDDVRSLLQLIKHVLVCISHIPLYGQEQEDAREYLRSSLQEITNRYNDDFVE